MSELTKRVLFGIIAAPVWAAIIYFGDAALAATIAILQAVAAWEFYRISESSKPFAGAGIVIAALIPLAVHGYRLGIINIPITMVLPLAVIAFLAAALWLRWPGNPVISISTTVFGVLYASMLTYLYPIRHHQYVTDAMSGAVLVMLPVFLTWASDIGGYMFGRMFGKHKLMPAVSPAKTIEGSLGGLALAILVCWVYVRYILPPLAWLSLSPLGIVIFAVAINVTAQTGDLAESMLKREGGVKDSSTIFPGHGGVLDRFDSMLFVMPVAYLLFGWLLIPVSK